MKSNQEAWMEKQLKKIPTSNNSMRLQTAVDAKHKVLEMAITQDPKEGQNNLSFMNTRVHNDMRSIPQGDKNELL